MKNIVIAILIAAITAFITVKLTSHNSVSSQKQESVYERVMRTGTIRCAYNSEPPFVVIDPNTHKVSGAGVDIIEQMGKLLNVKIDWAEQVGWDMMAAGLQNNRYDLICNGKWVLAPQARGGQFTPPIYFTTVNAYGRTDETRLHDNLDNLNDPAYTVTSMDGEVNFYLARDLFPNAKKIEFPSMTDNGQLFEAVLTKKADATFAAGYLGNDYMQHNPGKIKQLNAKAVSQFDTAYMFKTGESAFAGILDAAIRQMHSSGTIKAILDRYHVSEDQALRVALPVEQKK